MSRARRAPGTWTALDVLRGLFRPMDPDAVGKAIADLDAGRLVDAPLVVSCFLRGSANALPPRWSQGILTLDGRTLTWRPCFWPLWLLRRRARVIRLPSRLDVEQVRGVQGGERFLIKEQLFRVIVCQATSGRVELGVPTLDVPLVRRAIQLCCVRPQRGE